MNIYGNIIRKAVKNPFPFNCLFEITYKCNLSCLHCYIKERNKKELDTKEIFDVLEQLKEAGCLNLTFSGGEIFMRKDFFKIAFYAKRLNFALRLFTNGTLIDTNKVKLIKELKPLSVEISLLGFKDTYEAITKIRGSFDKVIRAVSLLKESGIKIYVKTTLLKENVDEIWRLNRFVEDELRVNSLNIGGSLLISVRDDGDRSPLKHRLTDNQLNSYIKEEFYQRILEGYPPIPRRINYEEILCSAGIVTCNITPYGELNPCLQIRLKENNSLKALSLIKIWKDNIYFKKIRQLRMKDRTECVNCRFISFCTYCPGMVWQENGSFLKKYLEFCRIARIRYNNYILLQKSKSEKTFYRLSKLSL